MEQGYYKPDLAEFHIGFEYEYLGSGPTDDWTKAEVIDLKHIVDIHAIYPYSEQREWQLRVKYLSGECVKALGWEDVSEDIAKGDYMVVKLYQLGFATEWYLRVRKDGILVIDNNKGFEDNDTLFRGRLKNKSELRRVMYQVGILE